MGRAHLTDRMTSTLRAIGELPATRKQLERRCKMTPGTASMMVNALMRRGMVTVAEGGRWERFVLTAKGRRWIQ